MTKPPPKLSKRQISEAIQQVPLDKILGNDIKLTSKQRKFSENIVLKGMNKTEAYRNAYDTNGKPSGQSVNANKVFNNTKVSLMINQLQASETIKHLILPTSLRALAIEKITELAIDDDLSPRDRLKALELIGKFTEVGLFEDRDKTATIVTNSDEVKQQLMDSLRKAIGSSLTLSDDKKRSADELLSEIRGDNIRDAELIEDNETDSDSVIDDMPTANDNPLSDDPPHPTPLNDHDDRAEILHNIPDNQSHNPGEVPTLDIENEEGEGVSEILRVELGVDIEMTPLDDSGSHD